MTTGQADRRDVTVARADDRETTYDDALAMLLADVSGDAAAQQAMHDATHRAHLLSRLASLRRATRMSQAQVAEKLGITQSVISDLENHRTDPRISTLQRYARALERSLRIMLDGEAVAVGAHVASAPHVHGLADLIEETKRDDQAFAAYSDARLLAVLLRELESRRKARRLSQRNVAHVIGMTQSSLSELENNITDPRLSTLQRYARAIGSEISIDLDRASLFEVITDGLLDDEVNSGGKAVIKEGVDLLATLSFEDIVRPLVRNDSAAGLTTDPAQYRVSPLTRGRMLDILYARGWLHKVGDQDEESRALRLAESAASFIGISVRRDHVRAVVTDLRLSSEQSPVYVTPLTETSPGEVAGAVSELVEGIRHDWRSTLGVGVELSGPIDGTNGSVIFAPDLEPVDGSPWNGYPLEAELEQRLNLKVVVENDATALATHEWLVNGGEGGLILVCLAESNQGIGAGLVFNGGIVRGVGGQSGELGHVTVAQGGKTCQRCPGKRRGCLETEASGRAIALRIGEDSLERAATRASHSERVRSAFHQGGARLGSALGDVLTVLNPARLVVVGPLELVGGRNRSSARAYMAGFEDALARTQFSKVDGPTYTVAGPRTAPTAAASVAVNHFLSHAVQWIPSLDVRG